MVNKFEARFIAVVKKAREKLKQHPRIVEQVLYVLYSGYVLFDIPIPTAISANEIAEALSSPGHEVSEKKVIKALKILVAEGFLPKNTVAAQPLYRESEELTEIGAVDLK